MFSFLFNSANETVNKLVSNFNERERKVELVRNQTLYVQKSMQELKLLIERAKVVETFKGKDISFVSYFNNLEKLKNDTFAIQANSTGTLDSIKDLLQKGTESLTVSIETLKILKTFSSRSSFLYFFIFSGLFVHELYRSFQLNVYFSYGLPGHKNIIKSNIFDLIKLRSYTCLQ